MSSDPWKRTCKRCGRDFEVALWCREVVYCDICKAELDAMLTESQGNGALRHADGTQVDTPGASEKKEPDGAAH
jgi:hypothetical protein